MKRKNGFVFLGAFGLALSMNLSGCGNKGDVPSQTTEVPAVTLGIPAEPDTPAAEAEKLGNGKLKGMVKQID